MSKFIWKLRYAWHMRRLTRCSIAFAWACSEACEPAEYYGCDPLDAVLEELSYWTHDE